MNFNFPKINKIEIIGLNLDERKKIESIINDANFKPSNLKLFVELTIKNKKK